MGYQIITCQQAGGKHCSVSVYMLLLPEVCGDRGVMYVYISTVSTERELTHLCLMFHYWNGSDVGVIYIQLRKVIAESDFSPMSAS